VVAILDQGGGGAGCHHVGSSLCRVEVVGSWWLCLVGACFLVSISSLIKVENIPLYLFVCQ
jgi:hypothetical protein